MSLYPGSRGMIENDIAVQVRDLRRTFGSFVAVDNISLRVEKGEIFGFLGPNGAGKSTTIRMLCGLLKPTSGGGSVAGFDILSESESIKQSIGYMSQRFSLYDDLTIEENINFFSGIYNVPRQKRAERKDFILSISGLHERKEELTKNLPTGFKQRLALGCAVLHDPSILFLDEPTSGVDPMSRRNFWKLIYDMAGRGTTVFVTTHYMDEADYCGRLALIYRGKIVAEGTPADLRLRFMKQDVLEIPVDRPVEALESLEKEGLESAIFGSALHVVVDDAATEIPRIERILSAANIRAGKIEKILPSLEDVFVALIESS